MKIRKLGLVAYEPAWRAMQAFNAARDESTEDQLWLVEHPPVFTLGLAGRREHVLDPGAIPVVATDRGGQVTYHGPGQCVVYVLLDLRRLKLNPRTLVQALENAVIDTVAGYGVSVTARRDAPGIYDASGRKLGAVGLRVRRHCSYHGLAVNVAMDLTPFDRINPCGYEGLEVTDLHTLCGMDELARFRADLKPHLKRRLRLG